MLPRYVNSCTGFSVVSSTLMSTSLSIIEFGWNITSVFLVLIFWPKLDAVVANGSTNLWSPLLSGKLVHDVCEQQFSHKYICTHPCLTPFVIANVSSANTSRFINQNFGDNRILLP